LQSTLLSCSGSGRTVPLAGCAEYYGDNTGSYTVKVTYTGETADEEEAKRRQEVHGSPAPTRSA
jgi:hypothetical protein